MLLGKDQVRISNTTVNLVLRKFQGGKYSLECSYIVEKESIRVVRCKFGVDIFTFDSINRCKDVWKLHAELSQMILESS